MIIIHVFDPSLWKLSFNATFYNAQPKKLQTLRKWNEESKADLTFNLCYFNMSGSMKGYTIEFLRIPRLGGDCGYGGSSDRLVLPNGDTVAGWPDNYTASSTRSAIGHMTSGEIFHAYSTDKMSVNTFKNSLKKQAVKLGYSVKDILMQDGGGSTGVYAARGKILTTPQNSGSGRAVASVMDAKYIGGGIDRRLYKGCSGDDVKLLQILLGGLDPDGIFGLATQKALKTAQKNLGLAADGIFGPKTKKVMKL